MYSAPNHSTACTRPGAAMVSAAGALSRPFRAGDGITATGLAALGVVPAQRTTRRNAASLASLVEAVRGESSRVDVPHNALAPSHGFASALILAPREELSAVERRALRLSGTRNVNVMTSGAAAARLLVRQRRVPEAIDDNSRPAVDVVICHEQLADMTALEFLKLVRAHPRLLDLPVLVVSGAATRAAVLAAIGAGCSGFLGRPYTVATLDEQLQRARHALKAGASHPLPKGVSLFSDETFDQALQRFTTAAISANDEAEIHFLEGTAYLLREQWDAAISAFSRALRCNARHAEACLGLSDAWRAKGDMDKSHGFRRRAGEIYARARQWERARQVFAQLLAESPSGTPNPLLTEAARLLRENRIDDAVAALLAGHTLTPDAPLHEHVARACLFTNAPERTAASVCRALSGAHPELGAQLHRRMSGRFGAPRLLAAGGHKDSPGLLERLLGGTVLHDILTVARHTLTMWRQTDI